MKKIFLLLFAGLLTLTSYGQSDTDNREGSDGKPALPYSKFLEMTPAEFNRADFKFDQTRKRYVLRRNYKIIVQYGKTGISFVRVEFKDPAAYHEIMDYLTDNIPGYKETFSDRMAVVKFTDGSISGELIRTPRQKTDIYTDEDSGYSRTRDLSYENFTYILYTGMEPDSKWHDKQRKKEQKRKEKGQLPAKVSELMW